MPAALTDSARAAQFNFTHDITLQRVLTALFGDRQPKRHLTFKAYVNLGNGETVKVVLKLTQAKQNRRLRGHWDFVAYVEDAAPDHQETFPVSIGQKVNGWFATTKDGRLSINATRS